MSKAAKQSLIILIFLLVGTLGYIAYLTLEQKTLEGDKQRLESEIVATTETFQKKETAYQGEAKKMKDAIQQTNNEKQQLEQRIQSVQEQAQQQVEELNQKIDEITGDRDTWKRRIDTIREERDKLLVKIDNLTKELEIKTQEQEALKEEKEKSEELNDEPQFGNEDEGEFNALQASGSNYDQEKHWADVLKNKASLEVEIQKFKDELAQKSVEIVEVRQKNEDLQIELENLQAAHEQIQGDLKHKSDMVDNMSLELARTKNDKKYVSDRLEKISEENQTLRSQMKQILAVKNSLEKSIVRLGREKEKVAGKLGDTETLIQSKIDEIWQIKEDLDRSIRGTQAEVAGNEVELPPIVVSSSGDAQPLNSQTPTGFNGKIISINDANNFVIVDIGENVGVMMGDTLSVYRDSKYIARVQVIQVRKDICAADIKDQWSKIQVGDIIR